MRLAVDESGRAGLRARRSHHIVTGTTCSQAVPGLMDGIETMCFTPGAEVILAMDSDGVRHIVEVGGTLTSHPHDGRGVRQFSHSPRGRRGHAYIIEGGDHCVERVPGVARSKLTGGKTMTVSADDRTFLLPATGFWQPHRAAAGRYRELVHELLPEVHGGVAWDLYGGVGLFADILAGKTRGPVDSVEVDKSARTWGRRSLQTLSERPFRLPSIRFVTSRVDRSWSVLRRNNQGGVDLVVLDPPRKGAGKKVIQQIAAANPRSVVHIACDPATGARDYAEWLSHGYEISSIRVIDAFPGTHHMEIIAALSKTS